MNFIIEAQEKRIAFLEEENQVLMEKLHGKQTAYLEPCPNDKGPDDCEDCFHGICIYKRFLLPEMKAQIPPSTESFCSRALREWFPSSRMPIDFNSEEYCKPIQFFRIFPSYSAPPDPEVYKSTILSLQEKIKSQRTHIEDLQKLWRDSEAKVKELDKGWGDTCETGLELVERIQRLEHEKVKLQEDNKKLDEAGVKIMQDLIKSETQNRDLSLDMNLKTEALQETINLYQRVNQHTITFFVQWIEGMKSKLTRKGLGKKGSSRSKK
jgi:hypothetical protein